ncbi:HNH endonuclease [Tenacibaculum piscium]|uniref:HNH endonuclease n=1 Tax=Tenacibaculum piscium TaxID=1458515 RepID=UPI00187B4716|nr:HNH endonuclease [Tenacibaculum piscium]MBE7686066.1 HNH endonuclease [Tenacibaculum piscium]MBE7690957.1 HNH endonuclease [Tenacibaculum piscium]MCG8184321.1 HNH endonuclease [Tenacibaculum piscium]MCG8205714.1 HNH endonuclease [Tenacibaculum piscium]
MIRNYRNEKWKELVFDNKISEKEKFKISNYGRIINCKKEEEFLVKEYFINGYQNLPLKQKESGKQTSRYVHKLVAESFLEKKEDDLYVIHLNYDKKDNRVENLKWTTRREKEIHQFSNPEYVNKVHKPTNVKLTETKVKLLKRKLNNPNRRTRLKILAKQFGVSEMQLHRIKTGENWANISAENV